MKNFTVVNFHIRKNEWDKTNNSMLNLKFLENKEQAKHKVGTKEEIIKFIVEIIATGLRKHCKE